MNETKSPNVCGVFLIKLLLLEGFMPETDSCPTCSSDSNLNYFSVRRAAFFCEDHSNPEMVQVSLLAPEKLSEAIISKRTTSVIANMTPEIAQEIESLAIAMIEFHSGSHLRAVHV
ncbi:MAG: DNA repair protein RecO C-terminal domain-containing protein [Acidimicrobiia bacterium]